MARLMRSMRRDSPGVGSGALLALFRIRELLDDALRDKFLYLGVSRDRLRHFRLRVLIPIVLPAVPDENCATFLNLTNQVAPLHATSSTEWRRT